MPEETAVEVESTNDGEEKGFSDAAAFFGKDEAPAPTPTPAPAPEAAKEPEEEPEPVAAEAAKEKTEPEQVEEEFIEFSGKQKERFNSVYGALKRKEREEAEYQRKIADYERQLQSFRYQQQTVAPQQPVTQPQPFAQNKPKLADFETADQWADAVTDWATRKVEQATMSRLEVQSAQQEAEQHHQSTQQKYNDFINGKIAEGQKKFGPREFNEAAKDIVEFAPHRSTMYNALFDLDHFPEVVLHLAKNLPEADRISSLRPYDQVYELKALEKRLALATKQQTKLPTKVEAPGAGEEPTKPSASVAKLRQAAKASGDLRQWGAVFQADPTL